MNILWYDFFYILEIIFSIFFFFMNKTFRWKRHFFFLPMQWLKIYFSTALTVLFSDMHGFAHSFLAVYDQTVLVHFHAQLCEKESLWRLLNITGNPVSIAETPVNISG